jgi:hypothetical protein
MIGAEPGGVPAQPPAAAQVPTIPLPRWLGPLTLCCVLLLIPWIVYLSITLPSHQRADDYDIAWVGFDCAMCLVLAALAYCAWRRVPATGAVAAVAATLLVVDAWFDIVTTAPGAHFTLAVLSAVFAELPLALICGWTAINAERVCARAFRGTDRVARSAAAERLEAGQNGAHPGTGATLRGVIARRAGVPRRSGDVQMHPRDIWRHEVGEEVATDEH